jgi:hypothetical protein
MARTPLVLYVASSLALSIGCALGGDATTSPGTGPTPGSTPQGSSVQLTVTAQLVDRPSRTYSFTADINGAGNQEQLYCQAMSWGFGDGPPLTVTPSCSPWTPTTIVQTRYQTTHSYSAAGRYEVTFTYGELSARTTVDSP